MIALWTEFRYALRQIRRAPGFSTAVVLCLALGIGANAVIFDLMSNTLAPMSGISDPDRLVRIYTTWSSGEQYSSVSWPDYKDIRDQATTLQSAATWSFSPFNLTIDDQPERLWGQPVSGNYFSTLGVRLAAGRDFLPEEYAEEGTHPVIIIISYHLWQSRFDGSPNAVGREVLLNGNPFTIVGVTAEDFESGMIGGRSELYVPLSMHAAALPGITWMDSRTSHWLQDVTARLAPGATWQQADAEVKTIMARLAQKYPDSNRGASASALPESRASLHPEVRPGFVIAMRILSAFVGFLLLLTCANVAGLFMARASARRKDLAVRLALGADRRAIIRQILVESVVLAMIAGVVAILFSRILEPITAATQPQMDIPLHWPSGFDPAILWFTPLVSLVAGLVFGLMPALDVARRDLVTSLSSGRVHGEKRTHRLRSLLVGGQVAVSLALLMGAGFLIRGAQNLKTVDPGFDPDSQAIVTLDLDLQGYDEDSGRTFIQAFEQRLEDLPGVESVGRTVMLPLNLSRNTTWVRPEGYEGTEEDVPSLMVNWVDDGYFNEMRIPIVRGRGFLSRDVEGPPRIVVNEAFVARFWPGESGIGKRVDTGSKGGDLSEIIGVVPTGKYYTLGEAPEPYFYRFEDREYSGSLYFLVRADDVDPGTLFQPIRAVLHDLDPAMAVRFATMRDQMDFALLPARLVASAAGVFAVLALLLASIGLYGLIAYFVARETRELGIRLAIGALPRDLLRLVIGRGMVLLGAGGAIGLILGVGLAFLVSGFSYQVEPLDPIVIGVALLILGGTTWLASYLPARRATRVDPVTALRVE